MDKLIIKLRSVGFKTGAWEKAVEKAHFILDARCVKDPSAKGFPSGDSIETQNYVSQQNPDAIMGLKDILTGAINAIPTRRRDKEHPYEDPFVVLCVCAHGIHRSRAVKHIMAKWLFMGTTGIDLPVQYAVEVE